MEASPELPGFSTLDEVATRIRAEVDTAVFTRIAERMGEQGRARLQALLSVAELDAFSMFHRLKKPAQRASWSRFKAQVDEIGDTDAWLEGVAPTKVANSAGALLRFLNDPALRSRITATTNKVESYNAFSAWLRFGNGGVPAYNDPVEQEKLIKLNTLLADPAIFHNALDIADIVRALTAEGWTVTAEDLAGPSPYLSARIRRFGHHHGVLGAEALQRFAHERGSDHVVQGVQVVGVGAEDQAAHGRAHPVRAHDQVEGLGGLGAGGGLAQGHVRGPGVLADVRGHSGVADPHVLGQGPEQGVLDVAAQHQARLTGQIEDGVALMTELGRWPGGR